MVVDWLSQPVTVPLWGFLVALVLPVAYFAKLAREFIGKKVDAMNGEPEA